MSNQEPLLRVEHLCQYFGPTKAVDDVSFDIKKGEVFGLVGESGCGKTTTGRSIIKLYDITSGSIYFKGQRICAGTKAYKDEIALQRKLIAKLRKEAPADAAERIENANARIAQLKEEIKRAEFDHKKADKAYARKRVEEIQAQYASQVANASKEEASALMKQCADELRIARKSRLITKIQMIFQDPIASLNPRMTVREIISEGLVIHGIKDKKYLDEKVFEILELVGLDTKSRRHPRELSGGEQQRLAIARALVNNPSTIIADEPTGNLDPARSLEIMTLLQEINNLGTTVLVVTHEMELVERFAKRVIAIDEGLVVSDGLEEEEA